MIPGFVGVLVGFCYALSDRYSSLHAVEVSASYIVCYVVVLLAGLGLWGIGFTNKISIELYVCARTLSCECLSVFRIRKSSEVRTVLGKFEYSRFDLLILVCS